MGTTGRASPPAGQRGVRGRLVAGAGGAAAIALAIATFVLLGPPIPGGSEGPAPGRTEAAGPAKTREPAVVPAGGADRGPLSPVSLEEAASLPGAAMADPPGVPPPVRRDRPATVRADITTVEKRMKLADGTEYDFWTFNGTVPGPFIRVREGDTVVIRLTNPPDSTAPHSIDLHAVTGPGGGAVHTQTPAGQTRSFVWKALKPGLYVYHCASAPVPMHIANGMYGLILVEPAGGLRPVDREFYVMQQEVYTAGPYGRQGLQAFSWEAMWAERPEYVVFNGAVEALNGPRALKAKTGEQVRIYFGVGGPNLTSSFHAIGEIFDRVYDLGSFTSTPVADVQTVMVPPGGAVAVELTLDLPGTFTLVDHALTRLHKGAAAQLVVEGPDRPSIFRPLH